MTQVWRLLGPPKQVKALWLCWLSISGHVIGGPAAPSHLHHPADSSSDTGSVDVGAFATPQYGGDAGGVPLPKGLGGDANDDSSYIDATVFDAPVDDEIWSTRRTANEKGALALGDGIRWPSDWKKTPDEPTLGLDVMEQKMAPPSPSSSNETGGERSLAAAYPFFKTSPYVNVVVFDSHGTECDRNYESPPISDPAKAGYPRDGTDALRKRNMACGIAPARFVFYTSDLVDYVDTSVLAKMQLRITCKKAFFVESDTCEGVLDATGDFPKIDGCRFMQHEARLILSTRLTSLSSYSITLKLVQPTGRSSASDNSFDLTVEFYQMKVIEGTMAPVDISHTIANAKDEVAYGNNYRQRGYVTSLTWQPPLAYTPSPGALTTFTFGIRTFGVMGFANLKYAIDFIAYPTNIWKLGTPLEGCESSGPEVGTTCELRSFTGALATDANGFRIKVGSTDLDNLGSNRRFTIRLRNPMIPINAYWTATSFQVDNNGLATQPYTVMLDKPISVLGKASGEVVKWDLASIGIEQWIELKFRPGSTLVPANRGKMAGILVIIPPETFTIITTSNPQSPALEYNSLPCSSWPEADRLAGRWVCHLEDKAIFKDTTYRVRLRVKNPRLPAAALSWRVEIWQKDSTKPISITRSIRGMPVSGQMVASVSQKNQLLSVMNTLQIEFTPSQDVGAVANTRLEVIAPAGFVVIKRCLGFVPIELPDCECQGNNANSFALVMKMVDALKASITYSFKIDAQNPSANVDITKNFWTFNTVRPDGVAKDTARYDGFSLYPFDFKSFIVIPQSRRTGSQHVTVRFTPKYTIPFDDYLRVRAPQGVSWDAGNLDFSSINADTDATTFGSKEPNVIFETPSFLVWQLTTAAELDFEYGIRARTIVPHNTPVPNMWWIEQFRQTGQSPPNQWRDIASMGATGYKSQVLIKTTLEPFNIVEEAWQNPTLITFEATLAVRSTTRVTALGTTKIPAEVYLEAPALFTYICPLAGFPTTSFPALPAYSQVLPSDVRCEVDHQNQNERNKLHLYFDRGLEANVKYAFVIDVVNAKYTNPANNKFILQTRLDGVMQEQAILPGFRLAKRTDNTRFLPGQPSQDNRVEMMNNMVTFIIGTTMKTELLTVLEVKAPVGYKFKFDCTQDIGKAVWVPRMMPRFPGVESCQNQQKTLKREINIAHAYLNGVWELGSYGLYVKVENPMFTPLRNFWGFTIYNRALEPLMSEAWVYGFPIQVILPDYYPGLVAYNPGNGVSGEAAMNIIDISFTLTTPLKETGAFVVTAPDNFRFPGVCRNFAPCLDCKIGAGTPVRKGSSPLSAFTKCTGNGGKVLTLNSFFTPLVAKRMYSFRVLIVNPKQTFKDTNKAALWWRYETKDIAGSLVDLHRVIPSFPIYQRLKYFVVDTLSRIGLQTTTLRVHFATTSPIPPQQTVNVFPPEGMMFYGVRNNDVEGACYNEDPVIISRLFPVPLISGVTRLPEWISCRVINPGMLQLKNEESILGGRPLISGPVYEVFVRNVTNPQSAPHLNIFRAVARTSEPLGQEVWAAEGHVIFPELEMIKVESSNEGFGLYTTFSIQVKVITEVPSGGSLLITAPSDFYFGPVIFTALTLNDPLDPLPPPSGMSPPRPPMSQITPVSMIRSPEWEEGIEKCPFDFKPCIQMDQPPCMEDNACKARKNVECQKLHGFCKSGILSKLMMARSFGSNLEVTFMRDVALPSGKLFRFAIQGYNTRYATEDRYAPNGGGNWVFVSRNSDSEKTTLDRKLAVPGIDLMGVVFMNTLVPSDTKIGVVENRVKITIRLTNAVPAKARLKIIHPSAFMRNANAAFSGALITLGTNFPRSVEKTTTQNQILLEALDEAFAASVDLVIDVGLSNPAISPKSSINVWSFETSSFATGVWVSQNCNRNVSGFKIFGQFGSAQVTGTVLSPTAKSVIAVWFVLKSVLPYSKSSRLRVWLPPGWKPLHQCGTGDKVYPYRRKYNPNREGVKHGFPKTVSFFDVPPGTDCYDFYDRVSTLYYIELRVDGIVDYGLDYGFEFGVVNPRYTPVTAKNVWRYETLMNGVILHLRQNIVGFALEEIKEIHVRPSDTTTLAPRDRIEFFMMSDKFIPGGSKISIVAPNGFIFDCGSFQTDDGLANTTTCYVKFSQQNVAEFTIDTQDPKQPQSKFRLFVNVFNPEFTPQTNVWSFNIISPLGHSIDKRDNVHGFDITGQVQTSIMPLFPYLGQINPLRVNFVPSTIMNQADEGNELVVTAPSTYLFSKNCTGFHLRLTVQPDILEDEAGYPSQFSFPPVGIQCIGFDNSTVVVRMPEKTGLSNRHAAGLLKNNYTLELDVLNPVNHSEDNTWSFVTRVRNPSGQRIVDANRTLRGFQLQELVPLNLDESAAPRSSLPLAALALPLLAVGRL